MIPVLIVDDEAAICSSIAAMLESRYHGQFSIHQVENGLRAIEFVSAQPVSLILADIKMPVLTGLDMLERLRALHYEGETIVISGFDDYALVRRAMKLGASDYLLKPISSEDFYLQIDGFLLRESQRSQTGSKSAASGVQSRFYRQQYNLERLIMQGENAPDSLLRDCGLCEQHRLIVCASQMDSGAGSSSLYRQAWQDEWEAALSPLFAQGCVLVQGERQRLFLSLFYYREDEQLDAFHAIRRRLERRSNPLVCSHPLPLRGAAAGFEECQQQLTRQFYNLPGAEGPEQYPYATFFSQMMDCICRLDAPAFEEHFSRLMALVCAQYPPVEQFRQLLCAMIYGVLQHNSSFIRVVGKLELTQNDAIRCIQNSQSAAVLHQDLTRIVRLLISMVLEQSTTGDKQHINRARAYIASHYAEDITLTALASHLSLHPNYVSTLFKQACGISFSHYLRQVRISEACRLMRESNDRLYEIADLVGYHDAVQFNRAFREEIGMSPREYKKKQRQ